MANSYFAAGTDKNTPFDKDCQRTENGVIHFERSGQQERGHADELRRAVRHRIITWADGNGQ